MPGLRCDRCGELLIYRDRIVAVNAGTAVETVEGTPGVDGNPDEKFHPACYAELRRENPAYPEAGIA